ncbi:glycosyltransferase [Agromyces sp. MMS24-JH15]|uniref:glycosyltransferase n=1 Tax=Agromyces sp. MMS24-JH15 TaxID=3243765 RepID=UPI003749B444
MKAARPRIVFVVTSLHGGGAEEVGVQWMRSFAPDADVTAVLVSDRPAERLPDGVALVDLGPDGHAATVRGIRAVIRRRRPDVVVALQTYPALLALAASLSVDRATRPLTVVSEHNLISLGLPGSPLGHRLKISLAKRMYRRADLVVACSHPVGGELVAGFGVRGDRLAVVPNPALAKARATRRVPRTPGAEHGIDIVLAGRLVPQKRPRLAIAAAARLRARGVEARVVSFGGGPLLEETAALARDAEVPFVSHGWVEDWFSGFEPNSVVLLPSVREGFGNVLVEAAACGVPAVAVSGALGVADAIIPGVTGELALDDDPDSLADALVAASGLEVPEVDDWLARFSPETSAALLLSAMRHAAVRRGRPAAWAAPASAPPASAPASAPPASAPASAPSSSAASTPSVPANGAVAVAAAPTSR